MGCDARTEAWSKRATPPMPQACDASCTRGAHRREAGGSAARRRVGLPRARRGARGQVGTVPLLHGGRRRRARSTCQPWNVVRICGDEWAAKAKGEGTGETGISGGLRRRDRRALDGNDAFDWQMTRTASRRAAAERRRRRSSSRSTTVLARGGATRPVLTRGPLRRERVVSGRAVHGLARGWRSTRSALLPVRDGPESAVVVTNYGCRCR